MGGWCKQNLREEKIHVQKNMWTRPVLQSEAENQQTSFWAVAESDKQVSNLNPPPPPPPPTHAVKFKRNKCKHALKEEGALNQHYQSKQEH